MDIILAQAITVRDHVADVTANMTCHGTETKSVVLHKNIFFFFWLHVCFCVP